MGSTNSKHTETTSTTVTTTMKTTKKKSRPKKTNKNTEVVNTSALETAVKISTSPHQCKAKLKSLLGECTQDTTLIDSVAKFFEQNRKRIESSAATLAVAGALGVTVLGAAPHLGISVGSVMCEHTIKSAILCGGGIAASAVGAIFGCVVIVTTGCLLFKKYRVMQESGQVKTDVLQKIQKLRDDMNDLLGDCNQEKFFKIPKSRFNDLKRQIDDLYVVMQDIVEKLEKQRKILNIAKKCVAVISGIAVVTGVIFCFTGIGAAVGVGLIGGGVVGLTCAYKLHKAEKEIEKEIEFYRNTFQCIQDLEFILSELERLQKNELTNTKEKFEQQISDLKDNNKTLFDSYWKRLREKGLLKENGCKKYATMTTTLPDKEKKI